MDIIVRATAANAQIRVFSAYTKDMVEEARKRHNTSPVCTAALGRLMTAASMMGSMLKSDKDILTLKIESDGPIDGVTVTADSKGFVKGYVGNPNVILPANKVGKLDVAGAVGVGFLDVIKDLGLKEPYVGQTELQTGEIAEDLTYYFASSEQTPSSVGLGVLMNKDNTVKQAGGFILQLMPDVSEETIEKIEQNLSNISSVTTLLDEGKGPKEMLEILCEGLDPKIIDIIPVGFKCNCSKERVSKALISVGKEELSKIVEEEDSINLHCDFCNTDYEFTKAELEELLKYAK
ncbi:MAG: Hsp33 family molecular chaperone HslO [Lachnospiraceae bacterium]|nr:Hsp33 family molecular chaperone HslO [Lachnospiraceae bacterium]MBR4411982.1 Hsp33 family molecular chaperone HslO [Lachnospiraceae bacterium]MBR5066302.1 Hsp33 family molecular chaperone HslO [Lachnospiraceae bacterium]MBR5917805.1 Hsp33 family molecular chaperone HslO [Lachnospiraceae bacterium]